MRWSIDDCKACVPPLLPENEDAEFIYFKVEDQVIFGMGGAVALNQMAIHSAMDLYEIEDRQDCFEKVVVVGRHMIAKQHEARKEQNK